ncbi:helix-turn-helix domain-containing protein [Pseudochelatococcus sp. B33]
MVDNRLATVGDRIAALHKGMSRAKFAKLLGIPDTSLGNYERNERKPDIEFLAILRRKTNVNINWVVTGEGAMFEDPSSQVKHPLSLSEDIMEDMARIVTAAYSNAGQRISAEKVSAEAAGLYNELLSRVRDINDIAEVEVTLPQLRYFMRRRLEEAAAEPGTGKREAS